MTEKKYNMTATKVDVIAAGVKRYGIDKQYVVRVLDFVGAMQPGEVIVIKNSDTIDHFVQVMKIYIYMYQGFTFSDSYEKIQRNYDRTDFIYPKR